MCYFCHTRKRGLRTLERRLRTLIRTLGLKTLKRTILLETLKYYATFKIRRFESFFYKMNIVLQKTITCIGLQAQQIFSVNILSKFSVIRIFFQFLAWLLRFFFYVISKSSSFLWTNFWTNFYCIVFLFVWAEKVCLRLLKSYFKLKIIIFVSFVLSFSVDMFN